MDPRAIATVALSGVILALGVVQLVRCAVTGAGAVAWVLGVAVVIAGGGRLWLWWRQRSG